MTNTFHWSKEDYFPYLMDNFKSAVLALEYLVDDLHVNKDETIEKLLTHVNIDNLIIGIVKLMASDNLRVSGNSAYVFGTISESVEGINSVLNLLNNKSHPESSKVLSYLVKLLKSSDYECMMNAAGTIGTISENNNGRSWLISQPLLGEVIELSTQLLENKNIWVSSNAALVIARITIEEDGCEKILKHSSSSKILVKMIESLGCDNAGRGMNCAFAIGRICDTENGRQSFLQMTNLNNLIESLFEMIETNSDNGCTKNACYAFSCLAVNQQAHQLIINHKCFENLIDTLCKLLTTVQDPETQWFAAMLMRIFSTFPSGCIKMKNISIVWQTLSELSKKRDLYSDVREEINILLDSLKPIENPGGLKATVLGPTNVQCDWRPIKTKSKLTINYILNKNEETIYNGPELTYEVKNLEPYTEYTFTIQALVVESNETSEPSDEITIRTHESIPSEPENLKSTGATTNIIRVIWDPPSKPNGLIKNYFVYNGENLVEQTTDLSSTLTGLQPDSSYDIYVCASTSKGKGEKAYLRASTCGLGDVTPEKPSFGMIGRREILVRWQPPPVLSGKLTRYELLMNSKCVYSGIMQEYQVIMLKPDSEYKFEVVAITTEGKFKSKLAKVRTLKDEYDPERLPLYPGPIQPPINQNPPLVREKTDFSPERKKSFDRPILNRPKTKTKIVKEILPTMLCEDIDLGLVKKTSPIVNMRNSDTLLNDSSIFSNQNSSNPYHGNFSSSSSKQFFPSLSNQTLSNNYYTKNELFSDESIIQLDRQMLSLHRGKTDLRRNSKNNNEALNFTSRHMNRSRTMIKSPNVKRNQPTSPVNSQTCIQPTIFTFNMRDVNQRFPVIPLITSQTLPHSSNESYNESFLNSSTNSSQVPSIIVKNNYPNRPKPLSESRTSLRSNDKKFDNDIQMQYQYLLNRLNKSKPLDIDDNMNHLIRSNTYVNR